MVPIQSYRGHNVKAQWFQTSRFQFIYTVTLFNYLPISKIGSSDDSDPASDSESSIDINDDKPVRRGGTGGGVEERGGRGGRGGA